MTVKKIHPLDIGRRGNRRTSSFAIEDGITPELVAIGKRINDLSVPMAKIKSSVLLPLKKRAWSSSGIKTVSGQLKGSVKAFSGKKSAGVGFQSTGLGQTDAGLAIARGTVLNRGAKKNQYRRKQRVQIRAHNRQGRNVSAHSRKNNGSPWGNIKKRQFVPTKLSGGDEQKIINIMEKYIVQFS